VNLRATLVSTVSQHSKNDIVRFYGVPAAKIHVIPDGVDTGLFRPMDDEPRLQAWRRSHLGDDVPFLLYVGRPSSRRNLPNLFRAFARLKREQRIPHRLALVGTALEGISLQPSRDELAAAGLDRDVVFVPYASHEDIAVALNACALFLYPSSYEGFGMPVLEAMACGTPAIALENTAFPEFAGGVARLLPDAEVGTLVDAIAGLLADPEERARMRREGPRRAAGYDWRLVTARYVELLQAAAALAIR
jgi:glycosyltransferase involved in cell wall biosynthesis